MSVCIYICMHERRKRKKERKKGGKGEMEGVLVKSEGNGGKRRVGNVENDSETPKCNKRRRREPVMAAVSGEDKGEVQDPSTTNTTATVKRSSLFRGVSRSGFFFFLFLFLFFSSS